MQNPEKGEAMRQRKSYEPAFRAKVALEAIRGQRTISQLSSDYKIHSNMILKWKKEALQKFPQLFVKTDGKGMEEAEKTIEDLYREIGKLKVENDYLKKKLLS